MLFDCSFNVLFFFDIIIYNDKIIYLMLLNEVFMFIHNFIKNTPYNAPFFKGIVIVPVLGHVVQIWKRFSLRKELESLSPSTDERTTKVLEFLNFGVQSFNYGKIGESACVIFGFAIKFFPSAAFTPVGTYCIAFGLASFVLRNYSTYHDLESLSLNDLYVGNQRLRN